MASKKRIASDLVAQRWYRMLLPKYKSLYIHLVCVANVAGVFELDCDSFTFHVKSDKPFTADEVFSVFGNRIQRIKGHPDKGLIVGYIRFQHSFPKTSQQWKWVENELARVGLTIADVDRMCAKNEEQLMFANMVKDEKEPEAERPQRLIIPPKLEWVAAYCLERMNSVHADSFFDFYASKGWKVGDQPMKDWQAAVRTWERDRGRRGTKPSPAKRAVASGVVRKVF